MARISLTGATGYVGGDVLHRLQRSSLAKLQLVCLVRDASKAQKLSGTYPGIEVVQGSLDDSNLVEQEARKADVVLNLAATSHAGAASAIAKGTQKRADSHESGKSPHSKAQLVADLAVHWIQIGGASVVAVAEIAEGRYGQSSQEIYDDLKDIDEIKEIIRSNPKRVVENNLLSQPAGVGTALLIVPLIYGEGRGALNQWSIQAPEIAKDTIQRGYGFRLQAGHNA